MVERSTIELTPSQKGAVAEAAITAEVMQLGLVVLRPLCEGSRYDLVVDLEPRLLRVQCKLGRLTRGAIAVELQTSRYTPSGYVRTSYSPNEVDAVGVYSAKLRRCFLLPIAEVSGMRAAHLRVEPSRNNQALGIKWAAGYELGAMIEKLRETSKERAAKLP